MHVNGTRQRVRWSSWSCFQRWASQARFETTRHNTILHTTMQCNGTTQYKATQCIATCPTILHTTTQRSTMQRNASQYNTRGRRRPRSDSENPPRPVYNDGSSDMLLHGGPPRLGDQEESLSAGRWLERQSREIHLKRQNRERFVLLSSLMGWLPEQP